MILNVDGYKTGHYAQYPEGTELVYSNWTPRGSRIDGVDKVVLFGLQYYIKEYLQTQFHANFFVEPKQDVIDNYKRMMDNYLGPDMVSLDHISDLHDLGYLPVHIRALPEGSRVPIGCPMFTITNTVPEFYWLTNMLETSISNTLWLPCTAATIAHRNRKLLDEFADQTGADKSLIPFLAHDFSMRGMGSMESARLSGAAHLLSSLGTDTVPAIEFLENYYNADSSQAPIGLSVPATEHSVMCMGTEDGERETYRRLICDTYPSGIVSIVSDTWDFWGTVTDIIPSLKDEIMARDGKVVIRPDSGNPVLIICGDPDAKTEHERKGLIECLADTFGTTTNDEGYKTLDSHIGAIYGDSITTDRMREILERLEEKKFASDNVVFGVGSFTYQYNTRDTFNFAIKATAGKVNGEYREIYKDPKTGDGSKKSARGFIRVDLVDGEYVPTYPVSHKESGYGELVPVFTDGMLLVDQSLEQIRSRLHG